MPERQFYESLVRMASQAPEKRYRSMVELHTGVLSQYMSTLHAITPAGAARTAPDGRSVAQVVAHIAEWDRATLLALGEVLAGVTWPRIMTQPFTLEPDGKAILFPGVDDFNRYCDKRHSAASWFPISALAEDLAIKLFHLFTHNGLVTPELLERTLPFDRYCLPTGEVLTLPCGWYLWMITLEHQSATHAADLALGTDH